MKGRRLSCVWRSWMQIFCHALVPFLQVLHSKVASVYRRCIALTSRNICITSTNNPISPNFVKWCISFSCFLRYYNEGDNGFVPTHSQGTSYKRVYTLLLIF